MKGISNRARAADAKARRAKRQAHRRAISQGKRNARWFIERQRLATLAAVLGIQKIRGQEFAFSKVEAIQLGLRHYFCPQGHLCLRSVGNAGCWDCIKEIKVNWSDNHRLAKRIANRKSRNNNIEVWRQRRRDYYAKHRIRLIDEMRSTAGERRGAEGSYTSQEVKSLYQEQKGICAACPTALGDCYHADHIIPVVRGGSNYIWNIQLLCAPCNLSKGAKDLDEWLHG